MAVNMNTPQPTNTAVSSLSARQRGEVREQFIPIKYQLSCLERGLAQQNRRIDELLQRIEKQQLIIDQLRAPKRLEDTSYFHTDDLKASMSAEQVMPDDISQEITHTLAGEEEDATALYPSVPSLAPRITSHHLSRDRKHIKRDFEQGLAQHFSDCRRPTNVVYTNSIARLNLFVGGVEDVPGITFRCRPTLRDDEFECASYEGFEESDSREMVSPTSFHLG